MLNQLIGESKRGRHCMIIVIMHAKIEAIEQFIIILVRKTSFLYSWKGSMNLVKK